MAKSRLLCLGLTIGLAAAGCSDGDDDGGDTGVDASDGVDASGGVDAGGVDARTYTGEFAPFDQAIADFVEENGLTGASAVIVDVEQGQLHVQGYGEFDADRLYLVASASKILSVGVLLHLADQGLIDPDAPIGMAVGDAFGDGKPELTLAQLLSNSSGLVALSDNPFYAPYFCQYQAAGTLTDCARTIYTADDAADRIPADTEFHYGGAQWQLSGGIAEVISGKTWSELVDETYRQPCGAESLGYTNEFERAALLYPDYFLGDTANLTETQNPSIEGGSYVNAGDYGKILLMHLRGGVCGDTQVLSEESVARMQFDRILEAYKGSTGAGSNMAGYGLGWWIDRENAGIFTDPGLYGAVAWLDLPRGYGAFIAIEGEASMSGPLQASAKPALDAILDARAARQP